jgi:hypothetical protein
MNNIFNAKFDFAECQETFSLPGIDDYNIVLICVNRKTSGVSSYIYDTHQHYLFQTNNITIPISQFLGAALDS